MKFNLLTKYILIYVSVAIIGFVGVTVISNLPRTTSAMTN